LLEVKLAQNRKEQGLTSCESGSSILQDDQDQQSSDVRQLGSWGKLSLKGGEETELWVLL